MARKSHQRRLFCVYIPATPSSRAKGKEESGFFDLPPELRNRVYAYLYPTFINYTYAKQAYHQTVVGGKALTQVSRAIRYETLPMYHGKNLYTFFGDFALVRPPGLQPCNMRWLRSIDALAVANLRHIELQIPLYLIKCSVYIRLNLDHKKKHWTHKISSRCFCLQKNHRRVPKRSTVNLMVANIFRSNGKFDITVAAIELFIHRLPRLFPEWDPNYY